MFTDNSNKLNELIKSIGYKYGLTAQQSYDIVRHEFEFLKHVMNDTIIDDPRTHKTTTIIGFGRFCIKSSIKTKYKKNE